MKSIKREESRFQTAGRCNLLWFLIRDVAATSWVEGHLLREQLRFFTFFFLLLKNDMIVFPKPAQINAHMKEMFPAHLMLNNQITASVFSSQG